MSRAVSQDLNGRLDRSCSRVGCASQKEAYAPGLRQSHFILCTASIGANGVSMHAMGGLAYRSPAARSILLAYSPSLSGRGVVPLKALPGGTEKSQNNTTKEYPIGPSSLFISHLCYLSLPTDFPKLRIVGQQ